VESLNELNSFLLYLPREYLTQLDQAEKAKILDQAKYYEWHEGMFAANIDIFR
jgi:hypothetical protein